MQSATEIGATDSALANVRSDLRAAYVRMCRDISRVDWSQHDAARGRPVRVLGRFPEVADKCLAAGASLAHVEEPLHLELARLRAICQRQGAPLAEAFLRETVEQGEHEVAQMRLAECITHPTKALLDSYISEAVEYQQALSDALQSARELRARMK